MLKLTAILPITTMIALCICLAPILDVKMMIDIKGLGGSANALASTSERTAEQGGKKSAAATTATEAGPGQKQVNDVQLSSEAKALQSLADTVKDLPEVNMERAEKIKVALENGDYKVNDLVLADKMLGADALL